ncbi:MAG TPA: HAMP domain-containing sensor histidine kinase [Candidatus Dormibacteraeota bacterium]
MTGRQRVNRRLERVNVASLRVAFAATAAFAVVYAIVAALIVVLVTNNLQSQLDSRLMQNLAELQSVPDCAHMFGATRAAAINNTRVPYEWINDSNGNNVCTNTRNPDLPAAARSVGTPTTLTVYNVDVRLVSAPVDGGRVVVAESLDTVTQTRDTIAFTEFIVGLVLLAVAFVGALYGGRRVGAPIEIARQRQMEFTADASHELRTPLSVIEAQTSLALAHDRDAAWYRNAFTRVGHESKRIRGLVEDLLWLARADSSPKEEHSDPVEVGVLAAQTVDRFTAVAESRGITIGLTVGPGPHMVTGSAEWLDRLLGVLIDNACKYAPEQGRVRVSVVSDGNRVRAMVEDSGPGIPPDERTRIFERFHRGTSDKPGAGLGLAIADAVVRRTHGRWEVGTSAALGGASVGVSWPRVGSGSRDTVRADASPQPAPAPSPASAPAPSPPPA